jgi:hypothetical protein
VVSRGQVRAPPYLPARRLLQLLYPAQLGPQGHGNVTVLSCGEVCSVPHTGTHFTMLLAINWGCCLQQPCLRGCWWWDSSSSSQLAAVEALHVIPRNIVQSYQCYQLADCRSCPCSHVPQDAGQQLTGIPCLPYKSHCVSVQHETRWHPFYRPWWSAAWRSLKQDSCTSCQQHCPGCCARCQVGGGGATTSSWSGLASTCGCSSACARLPAGRPTTPAS